MPHTCWAPWWLFEVLCASDGVSPAGSLRNFDSHQQALLADSRVLARVAGSAAHKAHRRHAAQQFIGHGTDRSPWEVKAFDGGPAPERSKPMRGHQTQTRVEGQFWNKSCLQWGNYGTGAMGHRSDREAMMEIFSFLEKSTFFILAGPGKLWFVYDSQSKFTSS